MLLALTLNLISLLSPSLPSSNPLPCALPRLEPSRVAARAAHHPQAKGELADKREGERRKEGRGRFLEGFEEDWCFSVIAHTCSPPRLVGKLIESKPAVLPL